MERIGLTRPKALTATVAAAIMAAFAFASAAADTAGRVAKGAAQGCIACHASAPGGDCVFNHDRLGGM